MRSRLVGTRPVVAVVGTMLALAACTSSSAEAPPTTTATTTVATTVAPTTAGPATTASPATTMAAPTTTTTTTSTTAPPTTVPATTAVPTTTAPATTTPATTPPGEPNPRCVRRIRPGDSLEAIVDAIDDEAVTVVGLQAENGIANANLINAGDDLDICVGNGVNDTTGGPREAEPEVPADPLAKAIQKQQRKLNRLFAGTGFAPLVVDGISGRYTQQALCAARLALGLPAHREDMRPGSREERKLMAARSIPIPAGAPVQAWRWTLIDRTCQVMFAGEGAERLVFVFPTSTGSPGYETRDQNAAPVFRFDPARENGGWHDSTHYPVPADNPLNGNMYLPLYFDGGQAIHGANNVPTDPQSKGCVRLRVGDQAALVGWLGLADAPSPVWEVSDINLVVSVQGAY